MIGKLKGRIDSLEDDHLIIDVGGVGYSVFCSARTLAAFGVGEAASLIIETHVREDHIHLYGFENVAERDWFRLLSTVQGVGSRTALAILGAYSANQLVQAILARDIAAFKKISGIGPKLAERIVTELKDKVGKIQDSGSNKIPEARSPKPEAQDAISALVNFGYSRSDAHMAVMKHAGSVAELDALVRLGLKELLRS